MEALDTTDSDMLNTKYSNIFRVVVVFLHPPKAEQISLPLEGGGPLAVEGVLYPNAQINTRL